MIFMLFLGIKPCGCVADALLSIDFNVGRLGGDPVVLEILRANLFRRSARNICLITAGGGYAGVITGRSGQTRLMRSNHCLKACDQP